MKVLVTGGTGFIGSHLVDALLARGDEVTCLVRAKSNLRWLENKPIHYVTGELVDPASLEKAVQDKDIIYHLAGVIKAPNRAGYERGNYIATRNLIEATYRFNRSLKRFVYLSSLAAVGPATPQKPVSETSQCRPITDYGRTKLMGELEVQKYANFFPITTLRPPVVYGPRDDGLLFFFKIVNLGIKPILGMKKSISIIYVDDLVRGIVEASLNPRAANRTYFITNSEPVKLAELVGLISAAIGKKTITLHIPDGLISLSGHLAEHIALFTGEFSIFNRQKAREMRVQSWTCTNQRAETEIGFQPEIDLEKGISRTVDWYRQHGWL